MFNAMLKTKASYPTNAFQENLIFEINLFFKKTFQIHWGIK